MGHEHCGFCNTIPCICKGEVSISLIGSIKTVIEAEIARCANDEHGRTYKLAVENVWNGIEPIIMGGSAIRKDAEALKIMGSTVAGEGIHSLGGLDTAASTNHTLNRCREVFEMKAISSYDVARREDGHYVNRDTEAAWKGWESAWQYRDITASEIPVNEAEEILKIFMNADVAFNHGDDVQHMLSFGKATERMNKYFHDKVNGGTLPVRESQPAGEISAVTKYDTLENAWWLLKAMRNDEAFAILDKLVRQPKRESASEIPLKIDEDAMAGVDDAAYARFRMGKPFTHHEAIKEYLLLLPERESGWVPVDDTDVEVAIAEAIAVMEPKTDYCEKGIPVLKYLKKSGWSVMQPKINSIEDGGAS